MAGGPDGGWPRRCCRCRVAPLVRLDERIAFDALPWAAWTQGGLSRRSDQAFETAAGEGSIDSIVADRCAGGAPAGAAQRRRGPRLGSRELASLLSDDGVDSSVAVVDAALSLSGENSPRRKPGELARLFAGLDGRRVARQHRRVRLSRLPRRARRRAVRAAAGSQAAARYLARPALDLEARSTACCGTPRTAAATSGATDRSARGRDPKSARGVAHASFQLGPDLRRWTGSDPRLRFGRSRARAPRSGPFPMEAAPRDLPAATRSRTRSRSRCRHRALRVDTGTLDIALTALAPGNPSTGDATTARPGGWLARPLRVARDAPPRSRRSGVAQLVLEPYAESRAQRAQAVRRAVGEAERRSRTGVPWRAAVVREYQDSTRGGSRGRSVTRRAAVLVAAIRASAAACRRRRRRTGRRCELDMSVLEALRHCPHARAVRTDSRANRGCRGPVRGAAGEPPQLEGLVSPPVTRVSPRATRRRARAPAARRGREASGCPADRVGAGSSSPDRAEEVSGGRGVVHVPPAGESAFLGPLPRCV